MGKFSEVYKLLKNENPDLIYLFNMGTFYNFINEDAEKMHEILELQITSFGNDIKCGFPTNSLEKYINKLNEKNINFKIIDNGKKIENNMDYLNDKKCIDILKEIETLNIEELTPISALNLISKYQSELKNKK